MAAEDGAILVFWALALATIFGLVALSFDFGQMAATKSELQSYADHVALAAAGELDGKDDAIDRARAAAANLIADSQTFGSGSRTLSGDTDYVLDFYATLPSNDSAALGASTTDPVAAIYARVSVTPRQVPYHFARVLHGLRGETRADPSLGAVAVAGYTQYACDITPLMFCIPGSGFKADEHVGDMIKLRSGGSGAAWGPGDFGFLDPDKLAVDGSGPCAGLKGAQLDACLIGAEGSVTRCFSQRGVDTEPGQKVGIENSSFNVRFDIYQAIMNGKKTNVHFQPAPNVIKGIVPKGGGSCIGNSEKLSPDTLGMPRDDCFAAGTCTRFGDGDWSNGRDAYVAKNYGSSDPHAALTHATRYEYYKAEIAAAGGGAASTAILTGRAETGRPSCAPTHSADPDRRTVIAAAIDCDANPIKGKEYNVPVEEFVRLFLTEPVGSDGLSPPTLDLWVEVIGSAGGLGSGGPDGVIHDVVQLYR